MVPIRKYAVCTIIKIFVCLTYASAQSADELDDATLLEVFGEGPSSSSTTTTTTQAPLTGSTPSIKDKAEIDKTDNVHGLCVDGVCVPYYLCSVNGTIIDNGDGIIDIRESSDCPQYLDICCKENNGGKVVSKENPDPQESSKGCGIRNENGVGFRIKEHDREAQFGEFPWMVAVLYEQKISKDSDTVLKVYQCGGSLIHPQVVLTAAHCVIGKVEGKKFYIVAGEWDTQTEDELYAHQQREVERIITHEKYYSGALYNDIALLILKTPVEFAPNVDVVCLPDQGQVIEDSGCIASGWGKDVYGKKGAYAVILKKLVLPYVKRDVCQAALRKTRLGKHFKLHESFICAGGEEGIDACEKDGGSPLICPIKNQPGRFYQAGIVAWGIGCGEKGIPGVYANVPLFRNWIDNHLKNLKYETDLYKFKP